MKKKLYYFNTNTEVLEGDHVVFKTLILRKSKKGRVSYIPKLTGKELADKGKQTDEWLIEFDDKTITGWIYSPEDLQPSKRLFFISRKNNNYKGINSQELEELDNNMYKFRLDLTLSCPNVQT